MQNSEILFQEKNTKNGQIIGIIILNNEKEHNALSLNMTLLIYDKLLEWAAKDNIVCVLIKSQGKKAFCSGGHLKDLYQSLIQYGEEKENMYAENFFASEYKLNYLIHYFKKPIICLCSGFVFGGGVGLMAGASHRIVNEYTSFAMPEIKIGFFPDVGISWFLSHMPSQIGSFIGITGVRINSGDALFVHLADHYLSFNLWPLFEENLRSLAWTENAQKNDTLITKLLNEMTHSSSLPCPSSKIECHQECIQNIFENSTPDEILIKMQESKNPWILECSQALKAGSPMSAWLAYEQLKRAQSMSLADVFRMDLTLAKHCVQKRDLREGIRALIIEKNSRPRWTHSSLKTVSQTEIDAFFTFPWKKDHPLSILR